MTYIQGKLKNHIKWSLSDWKGKKKETSLWLSPHCTNWLKRKNKRREKKNLPQRTKWHKWIMPCNYYLGRVGGGGEAKKDDPDQITVPWSPRKYAKRRHSHYLVLAVTWSKEKEYHPGAFCKNPKKVNSECHRSYLSRSISKGKFK